MTTEQPGKLLYTPQETADILGMSAQVIYDLGAAGRLRRRYMPGTGGRRRFWHHIDDIKAFADTMPEEPNERR